MRTLRFATALLFGALSTLAPCAVLAQPADAMERARKAFAEGESAESRGDCAAAIARFEEVASVKETPAVRLRIGRCHDKLGKLVSALQDYERAKELAASDPQALEVATQVADDLAKRIPRVEVRLVGAPETTVVRIDEAELPSTVPSRPVDPGRHRVTAKAPGFEGFEQTFELQEGKVQSLTIALRALAEPAKEAPAAPQPAPEEPFPWLPVGLYGGAVAAVGVGIPLLVTSLADDASLDDRCFDTSGAVSADRVPCLAKDGSAYSASEQEDISSQRDSINTRQIVGWALVGVGAAAAGVATVLLLTEGDDDDDETPVAATPILAPGFAGFSASGRF